MKPCESTLYYADIIMMAICASCNDVQLNRTDVAAKTAADQGNEMLFHMYSDLCALFLHRGVGKKEIFSI